MRFFFILFMIFSIPARAGTDHDYLMRVSWVKNVKELMLEIEKKQPHLLVKDERNFLRRFRLLQEAWAESDSQYNCFYGGWPSVRKGKYCQNPGRTNSSYDKTVCKENELQCNPLLFGGGLCVPGGTQAQRNRTFSNCEKGFQKEKNGSYDFLRELSREEAQELSELSAVAGKICSEPRNQTAICRKILEKVGDGLKAIDLSQQRLQISSEESQRPVESTRPVQRPQTDDSKCPTCQVGPQTLNTELMEVVREAATTNVNVIYDRLKEDFLGSPFCDPHSVISDPAVKPSPVLMSHLLSDVGFIDFLQFDRSFPTEQLKNFQEKYSLSQSVINEVTPHLERILTFQGRNDESRTIAARAKGLLIQEYLKNYKHDPQFMKKEAEDELVRKNIFKRNENGEAECPFVTKDAFLKALAGREEVLKRHGGRVKNKNLLTVVDYTRPSNERRMFVIDLSTNKVVHNTWVAHGSGSGRSGADNNGANPQLSNTPGSNRSSDGFVIASHRSAGPLYGPNVILKGIDENNGNMERRGVILHKWSSPFTEYSAGTQDYDRATDSYGPVYDVNQRLSRMNFQTAEKNEMENALSAMRNVTFAPTRMSETWGCLGVPLNNIRHLDRNGRNISQLEALRADLPGTLMFNYSGPEMQSRFF